LGLSNNTPELADVISYPPKGMVLQMCGRLAAKNICSGCPPTACQEQQMDTNTTVSSLLKIEFDYSRLHRLQSPVLVRHSSRM